MVRIEDLSKDEKQLSKKRNTLVGIAQELFGDENISKSPVMRGTFWCGNLRVDVRDNRIHVDDGAYFESAVRLATAYEERAKENWTVKKNYAE